MKKFLIGVSALAALVPALAFADVPQGLQNTASGLTDFVKSLTDAANALIPFFLAIAVVVFIYGVIKFILATGAEDKAVARGFIIYGIIGIAVIVSLFGIIKLLQRTVGISSFDNSTVDVPQFQTQ